jgi:hypothetical protein
LRLNAAAQHVLKAATRASSAALGWMALTAMLAGHAVCLGAVARGKYPARGLQ